MRPHIGTVDWVEKAAGRIGVYSLGKGSSDFKRIPNAWHVCDDKGATLTQTNGKDARFPTHAEAIHYAHREARKAVAAHFTLPPESETPC